jgi:small subunit ribosomal protein S9
MTAAKAAASKKIQTIGKRKTSIARIFLKPGQGTIQVNDRAFGDYFGREAHRYLVMQPLDITATVGQYDVEASIFGGGPAGQADALKYAIAKSLLRMNPDFRKPLKNAGLLTRDSRIVERKKYGRRGARKRSQYSKR